MRALKVIDASNTAIKKLPDSTVYLKKLVKLQLNNCHKLKMLPRHFGELEGLKTFDASRSAIKKLPDSFVALINLVELKMTCCTKLRKLPDSFGRLINLEHLVLYGCTNITSLPSTIWKLKSLRVLNMEWCAKLERLPEQLGKMQCLEEINVHFTGIVELPDSLGILSNLEVLEVNGYNLTTPKYMPSSIRNLTSLRKLNLIQQENHTTYTIGEYEIYIL